MVLRLATLPGLVLVVLAGCSAAGDPARPHEEPDAGSATEDAGVVLSRDVSASRVGVNPRGVPQTASDAGFALPAADARVTDLGAEAPMSEAPPDDGAAPPTESAQDVVLSPAGARFRYLDDGSDPGRAFRAEAFSDADWAEGAAQLGYGDGDEATLVSYGKWPNRKYITTYFRRSFELVDPTAFDRFELRLLCDDGAVVYLNGLEVARNNLRSGLIDSGTLASSRVADGDEATFHVTQVPSSRLRAGRNVIAAEVHQASADSSDLSFDLEVVGRAKGTGFAVTRGPYLQQGTQTSVTLRWRTNEPTDSLVAYGVWPSWRTRSASLPELTTEHEVTLSSLRPSTRYYYAVGSSTELLAGDDTTFFETAPPVGSRRPIRIWVIGDAGKANANARAVYDAYRGYAGRAYTDLWLMLGDNAYTRGTDAEYQTAVFDMYPELLRQTVLWPTLGNHDGGTADSATQSGPYYDIFSLPTSGEAGGLASGTEAYYAFDYANVHFVVLDSYDSSRAPDGAMLRWLEADLQAAQGEWLIAFFHHPPYSKGSHDSDNDIEMVEMRQNALPILEDYGVDLVLTGHSHSYERSYLLDGHYGHSSSLRARHILDRGDGRPTGDGAYGKPTAGLSPHEGAVYVVAGSSGQVSGGPLNHPAMFVSLNALGSLVLDLDGLTLDARFLDDKGSARDQFRIEKGN